jgi:5S rRNA maturation endonuclease (ribonuclease M5)
MTLEEMKDVLSRLNIEIYGSRGDEINAICVAHKDRTGHIDHNPSFWINSDSGAFICFSCQWKGNIYTLISYVEGIDTENASTWISKDSNFLERFQRLNTNKEPLKIEEPKIVSESMLKAYIEVPIKALASRGLTIEAANKHGIVWNRLEDNWVIPLREPLTSKLLGWQEKGYMRRYFKNMANIKKSEALFGYELYKGGNMIVVESPLDVVRLSSLGICGGVAVMGATVSNTQFKLISGADKIIFALDNDPAGHKSTSELIDRCREFGVEAWFFNYSNTDMKDIGGMSRFEIEWGINNAQHIVRGEKIIL